MLVMRENRAPEAIEAGTAKLIGTDCERIFTETQQLLDDQVGYEKMAKRLTHLAMGGQQKGLSMCCKI